MKSTSGANNKIRSWQLKQAARYVHAGGVIAYPTEAVYGLGCDPLNANAILRLLQIKNRPVEKGLILIAAEFSALQHFLAPLDTKIKQRIERTWPGPVTWLLPAHPDVPVLLRGKHDTIAVRVTAHPMAAALCQAAGGNLVSTSANLHRQTPARSALQVRRRFGNSLDYVLTGDVGNLDKPTPIRDAHSGRIVRPA